MLYKLIVDNLIANDLSFSEFEKEYSIKYGKKPDKKTIKKALLYFETGL